MTRLLFHSVRRIRLVPIVTIAIAALFALKALGLMLDGGYLFDNLASRLGDDDVTGSIAAPENAGAGRNARPNAAVNKPPAPRQRSWAQQMLNYPDVTGSIETPPGPPKEGAEANAKKPPEKPQDPPPTPSGTPVLLENERPLSSAERAVLESLQKRRSELDGRARELDLREDLIKAAEKRLEARITELKDLEARVDHAVAQKDEAEIARFKNVVTMYENMKAKDAAKIFDGLDVKVLLDVAKELNPRRMSDILAQMSPETAQRLTTELAARSSTKEQSQAAALPKIQGRPSAN